MDPVEALSEKINPFEIKNKEFKRTLWGYSPPAVIAFLDATARAWERVQRHERQLAERVVELQDELLSWKQKEEELERLKDKAIAVAREIREEGMKEAEAMHAEMRNKAQEVRTHTEEWLATVISEVESTENLRKRAMADIRAALDKHCALLDENESAGSFSHRLTQFIQDKSLRSETQP